MPKKKVDIKLRQSTSDKSTSEPETKNPTTEETFPKIASTKSATPVKPIKTVVKPVRDIEPVRFTVRRDLEESDGSIGRILIYIAVVVVIGVALTLVVQNFITGNNDATAETPPATVPEGGMSAEPIIAAADIAKSILPDTSATKINENENFDVSDVSLGSSQNDAGNVSISKLSYSAYTSFSRTSWLLAGINGGLPATKVSHDAVEDEITVTFSGIEVEDEDLLQEISVDVGNVISITGSKDGENIIFVIKLKGSSKYYVFMDGIDKVSLDVKTTDQLSVPSSPEVEEEEEGVEETVQEEEAEEEEEEGDTTPSSMTEIPEAPHYDNTASLDKQYVMSKISGKKLINETYYYQDNGDSFQFSWALRNPNGGNSVPNATAELIQPSSKYFIEVKIKNLSYDLLHSLGRTEAQISIPTTGSNLVKVLTKGYSNGVATFWVRLREETEFRLHATQKFGGYQLLSIEVMD